MDRDRYFARLKQAVNRPRPTVYTPELEEYIGASIDTPMGRGRLSGIVFAYSRRVAGKTYKLYTLTIDIAGKQYKITTYEHTQWELT